MARVVLAMSGGVDSSVAAHLLLDAGHEVVGVFMRHGSEPAACDAGDSPGGGLPVLGDGTRADHKQGCCTASDAADARRVAGAMGIPFYALDLQSDFSRIMDYFADDYLAGRTPNPCLRCNQWIKFGRLFDYADGVDAEFVATGHYARMDGTNLLRGVDTNKDQSYALFGIERQRLSRMLLPVGGHTKPAIRDIAASLDLGVASKKDSQEICFVTTGHHRDFVRGRRRDRSATGGQFVMTDGSVVGEHDGYESFTVGQRKGLGIAVGRPVFVVRIEPDTRRVVLGERDETLGQTLTADEPNWLIEPDDVPVGRSVSCQIRYNSPPKPAVVTRSDADGFDVRFDAPESAIAPGQAAVIYDGDRVLGGGWIK